MNAIGKLAILAAVLATTDAVKLNVQDEGPSTQSDSFEESLGGCSGINDYCSYAGLYCTYAYNFC